MAEEHDDETLDPDLEEELEEDIEELDAEVLDEPLDDDDLLVVADTADAAEEEDDDAVPTARATTSSDDDDDDDLNPDDVETDLDTILKDRLSASDDDDEDDEEDAQPETSSDGGKVPAKADNEFTCTTCFMIHHPRQFGRPGAFTCPEGYDPCAGIAVVEASLKRSRKG